MFLISHFIVVIRSVIILLRMQMRQNLAVDKYNRCNAENNNLKMIAI